MPDHDLGWMIRLALRAACFIRRIYLRLPLANRFGFGLIVFAVIGFNSFLVNGWGTASPQAMNGVSVLGGEYAGLRGRSVNSWKPGSIQEV